MSKKVKNAWAFYDWANSVYSLVISTAVFPNYFAAVTENYYGGSDIPFLGMEIPGTSLYSYSLSFSFIIVALISPFLSGIADHTGSKKSFLRFFANLGALSCGALFFFDGSNLWLGLTASILASIGFWGSLVFYNAFLPEVAPPDEQDSLSAKGFSLGYAGSSILLILNLVMIQKPELFGLSDAGEASRWSFVLVALWWAGFAHLSLRKLPKNPFKRTPSKHYIFSGFKELRQVLRELKDQLPLRRFLYAFFAFSMGVQTVILLASLYGKQELGMEVSQLIGTILIIQFVGIAGAHLFSFLSKKLGNKQSLKISIFIWGLLCFAAYSLSGDDPNVAYKFYALGGMVGLVMGGIQAISRSTYSKLLPDETKSHASYFSFYDVTEKLAIVLGTFSYGYLIFLTGSMRMSALALSIFFVIGYLLILRMPKSKHVY
jgi:UMF1 family MFS transporter